MDVQKAFLLILTGLLTVVAWLMVRPFLGYILASVLLAFMLHPVHKKTRKYLGDSISSITVVLMAVLAAIIPLTLASAAVVNDASDLSEDLNSTDVVNTTVLEEQFHRYTGQDIDIERLTEETTNRFTSLVFGNFSRILNVVGNMFIGFTLMTFLSYYLLKDGDSFIRWVKDLTPVSENIQSDLYDQINRSTWAVLKGHVLVAVIQGAVAGIGLAATGVPNAVFWTFVMIMLGFIPIIGTAGVWVPAVGYLVLVGRVNAAILLFLYGTIMVGLVDNIVRPLAVDRSANIHPAVIIIGVLGGLHIFGAIGLFIGPVVLGALKSILMVFTRYYTRS
ncbi:AI-2E family transporter [Candidatus Nanohalococcus occultus]|uniref:AI-2E family transporter n=1 Tax=Candidatus Nanohalococcus occultus TaxID=2978047 RepID=UPI0039DFC0FE